MFKLIRLKSILFNLFNRSEIINIQNIPFTLLKLNLIIQLVQLSQLSQFNQFILQSRFYYLYPLIFLFLIFYQTQLIQPSSKLIILILYNFLYRFITLQTLSTMMNPQPHPQSTQTFAYPNQNQFINHQNALNQNDEQQINQAIVQGFGQFFFNAHDPEVAKTNVPLKKQSSKHVPIILATLLMIGGIVAGIVIVGRPQTKTGGIVLLIVPYVLYLIISIFCSDIRGYIMNLKKFDQYKQTYDKMVKGRGYFHFWIQCYHYRTVRTKNGTRREKVVTHTATQNYYPAQSIDQSGNITGIQDLTKYVFINYLKKFYFTDVQSEHAFNAAYNSFVSRNRRDQYQNYTQTFEIQGFEEQVGFCMLGESPHNIAVFFILTFFGLKLPYACILQRSVSRYQINILKRLTC